VLSAVSTSSKPVSDSSSSIGLDIELLCVAMTHKQSIDSVTTTNTSLLRLDWLCALFLLRGGVMRSESVASLVESHQSCLIKGRSIMSKMDVNIPHNNKKR